MTDDYVSRTINTNDTVLFKKSWPIDVDMVVGPTVQIPEAVLGRLTPDQISELFGAMFDTYEAKLREFDAS